MLMLQQDSNCEHCRVRKAMQEKYIAEMMDLYAEDVSFKMCSLKVLD